MARKALLATLVLFLAACGGTKVHRTHFATTKAFAAAADGVCAASKTRGTRIARLHTLVPPQSDRDLYNRWLTAERDALSAAKAIATGSSSGKVDPQVLLAIAEGKIAGYSRRLGADTCAAAAGVTMPS